MNKGKQKENEEKDHVEVFNKNFICDNDNVIKDLYLREKNNIWRHPLVLDYDHCMICREQSMKPYTLNQSHMSVVDLYDFFKRKKIAFRNDNNRRKITRLIHSVDNLSKRKYLQKKQYEHSLSDTELVFDYNKRLLGSYKKKTRRHHTATIVKYPIHYAYNHDISIINNDKEKKDVVIQTDDIIIKDSKRVKSPRLSNVEISKYKNHHGEDEDNNDDESLSLTEYNDNLQLTINNPYYQSLHLDIDNSNENIHKGNNQHKLNTCDICFQELNNKTVLSCGDFYCKECIQSYILNCVNSIAEFNKLYCPKEICKHPIQDSDIKKLISTEDYDHYLKVKKRVEGLSNPSLIPCPFPDCESYSNELSNHKKRICTCENNHFFCSKCLQTFIVSDPDHHCNKLFNKQDETMKYFKTNPNIKQCPNCHCYVQREQAKGCNNMTCQNPWCNYQFCWICENQYDAYHYKNPFSPCFGLGETDYKSKFAKYKSVRIAKCVLIFFLLIFIVLPICMALFSLFSVGAYVLTFVVDGSVTKNIKFKHSMTKKVYEVFGYMFYICYAIAFIPLGYIAFALGLLALPIYCLIQKKMQKKAENDYS